MLQKVQVQFLAPMSGDSQLRVTVVTETEASGVLQHGHLPSPAPSRTCARPHTDTISKIIKLII